VRQRIVFISDLPVAHSVNLSKIVRLLYFCYVWKIRKVTMFYVKHSST